ncbi:unnamed protein product [Mytilus coruscus]|uniref:Uncharacterized protein n=1 Tax=Mytilus coruscus TaxID=42192 RepID=A0A6J8BFM5_MYTCO|nr:unnamed protein product [Mytilus coruscus]
MRVKSSENVDESENVRNLKRVKKKNRFSTENVDESGNVRQSKRRKKEQEQLNCKKRSQLYPISFSGDVDYQVQSLNTLTEALVDKEATKKAVCRKMKGASAQKKGDIEKTKEIIGHVIGELNKTNVNKAMHGKVFEAF